MFMMSTVQRSRGPLVRRTTISDSALGPATQDVTGALFALCVCQFTQSMLNGGCCWCKVVRRICEISPSGHSQSLSLHIYTVSQKIKPPCSCPVHIFAKCWPFFLKLFYCHCVTFKTPRRLKISCEILMSENWRAPYARAPCWKINWPETWPMVGR